MSYVFARITESDFRRWLKDDQYANWEPWAISLLWDYVSEMSESMEGAFGTTEEYLNYCDALTDPVAIRCEWSQYDDLEEWYSEHGEYCQCPAAADYDDMDEWRDDAFEWITSNKLILWNGDPAGGFVFNSAS